MNSFSIVVAVIYCRIQESKTIPFGLFLLHYINFLLLFIFVDVTSILDIGYIFTRE